MLPNLQATTFQSSVLAPPLQDAAETPWSAACTASSSENRRALCKLIAETLSSQEGNSDGTSNGAVDAALFLGKLCLCSLSLRRTAGDNALWRPLVTMCFGAEAELGELNKQLPKCGPYMCITMYGSIVRELQTHASFYTRSLVIERGGRPKCIVYDPTAPWDLAYRDLTTSECSRVAIWAPRFTLIDESHVRPCPIQSTLRSNAYRGRASYQPAGPPPVPASQFELPDDSDASSKPLGTSRLLEIIKKSKQSERSCSFDAPPEFSSLRSSAAGSGGATAGHAGGTPRTLPYVTVEHLVRSIAAFEEGHGTEEERRRWQLVDLDPVEEADAPSTQGFRAISGGGSGEDLDPRLCRPGYKHVTAVGEGGGVGGWIRRPGGGWIRRADAAVSAAQREDPMEVDREAATNEQRNGPTFQLVWVLKKEHVNHSSFDQS